MNSGGTTPSRPISAEGVASAALDDMCCHTGGGAATGHAATVHYLSPDNSTAVAEPAASASGAPGSVCWLR